MAALKLRRLLGLSTLSSLLACSFIVETDEIDAGCPPDTKFCGGNCVDVDDPTFGCEDDRCDPCQTDAEGDPFASRTVPVCRGGSCVVGPCAFGYGCPECNMKLLTDAMNCGSCEHVCALGESCSLGICVPEEGIGGEGGGAADSAAR